MEDENAKHEHASSSRVKLKFIYQLILSKFMAIEIGKNPIIYIESH
jgi:hypothetical protein